MIGWSASRLEPLHLVLERRRPATSCGVHVVSPANRGCATDDLAREVSIIPLNGLDSATGETDII